MSAAADVAPFRGVAARTLRIAGLVVRYAGPAGLVPRVIGPLATLAVDSPPDAVPAPAPAAVEFRVETSPADEVPPAEPERATRFVAGRTPADAPRVLATGIGVATLARDGPSVLRVAEDLPRGDEPAERLTIPALAERMRREGVHLLHAAVLLEPGRRRAWLVPASRGGGKTTLSLSLRRAGWRLASDDRGWLLSSGDAAAGDDAPILVDPWPEPPRVGDRSLFLLPRDAAPSTRDPATAKAQVPTLTPPRIARPVEVGGVLLPRLAPGRGGDVAPVRGAPALAAFAPHAVLATDPGTAAASLALVARLLARVLCLRVDVGDDPAALASGVSRYALSHSS